MPALLTIKDAVSQASMEIGITQSPVSSAVGSGDQDISQMVALMSAVADELLLEAPYKMTLGDGTWVIDGATGLPKDRITADSDRIAFDGRLAINGIKFRFLGAKGLEFGEAARDFSNRLNKLAGRVEGRVLDLYEDEGRVI